MKFYQNDMKTYLSTVGGKIDYLEQSKDLQIDDLKSQLSDIPAVNKWNLKLKTPEQIDSGICPNLFTKKIIFL